MLGSQSTFGSASDEFEKLWLGVLCLKKRAAEKPSFGFDREQITLWEQWSIHNYTDVLSYWQVKLSFEHQSIWRSQAFAKSKTWLSTKQQEADTSGPILLKKSRVNIYFHTCILHFFYGEGQLVTREMATQNMQTSSTCPLSQAIVLGKYWVRANCIAHSQWSLFLESTSLGVCKACQINDLKTSTWRKNLSAKKKMKCWSTFHSPCYKVNCEELGTLIINYIFRLLRKSLSIQTCELFNWIQVQKCKLTISQVNRFLDTNS